MGGCCRWSWLVRQGDTPDEARIKTIVFPLDLCLFFVVSLLMVNQLRGQNQMIHVIGYAIQTFTMLLFMVGVLTTPIPVGYLLDASLVTATFGLLALDLGNATTSSPFRSWVFVVLVLDCALVLKRYHMPLFVIPVVMVYHIVLQLESSLRFGLYELGYWGTAGVDISSCNCASP
eukprot:Hpha_TRINITY_DN15384_c3_g3::TRINITY_DN15384_c3_g3_i1::g.88062::m.88062